MLGAILDRKLQLAAEALFANEKITAKDMMAAEQKLVAEIQDMDSMDLLPGRRTVTLSYRGRSFNYKSRTMQDLIDVTFMTMVKERAVAHDDLKPIMCENTLVGIDTTKGKKGQFAECLLGRLRAAREDVNAGIEKMKDKSGSAIVAWMQKNKKSLTLTDSTFVIELQFWQGMTGSDGAAAIRTSILQSMPTAGEQRQVVLVHQECLRVFQSDLCLFCDEAVRNEVATVVTLLEHLKEGRTPSFPKNPNEFMTAVRTSLGFFVTCLQGEGGGKLYGEKACKHLLQCAMKTEAADLKLDDCEVPLRFGWMLTKEERKQVDTLRDAVLEKESKLPGAKKVKAGGPATAAGAASSSAASSSMVKRKASELDVAMVFLNGQDKPAV